MMNGKATIAYSKALSQDLSEGIKERRNLSDKSLPLGRNSKLDSSEH
jgi:hypothetical protein